MFREKHKLDTHRIKKRYTHTISVTTRSMIFLTTISGPNHQRECRHRESSNDQLPRLKQILIPCTILNCYCSTYIVYKESLTYCLSTSLVFICSKTAHIPIFVNHRRSESELLDNVGSTPSYLQRFLWITQSSPSSEAPSGFPSSWSSLCFQRKPGMKIMMNDH